MRDYLYRTPSQKIEIKYGDVNSLTSSGLLNGITTTVLIDGFLSSSETPMPVTLRNCQPLNISIKQVEVYKTNQSNIFAFILSKS